jgi:PAS domain S-box-containing protein
MPFIKKKNKEFDLSRELDLLLKQVESLGGLFDLSEIFSVIGKKLEKLGIGTIITIPDKRRINIVIKYLNKAKCKFNLPFKEGDKVSFSRMSTYKKILSNKKVVYCKDRSDYFIKLSKSNTYKDCKGIHSIISPLILRGEIVGFLEIFSKKLKSSDVAAVDVFSKELVFRIANMILFTEVQRSEEKYRNLFEKANDGFYVINGRMKKFIDVNHSLCDISGYTRGELLQMNIIMLFEQGERRRIENYIDNRLKNGDKTPEEKAPQNYETKLLTKNKNVKNVEINIMQFVNLEEWFVVVRDVTEKKRIKKDLDESKRKYQLLADNISDLVCVVDADTFKFTYSSPSVKKVLGYNPTELLGLELSRILTEDSYVKAVEIFNRELLSDIDTKVLDKSVRLEFEEFHKNGQVVVMEITASLMVDENEKAEGILMIGRDITNRKKTELALQISEKRYRSVFENTGTATIIVDKKNIIITSNTEFKKLSGYSKKDIEEKVKWIDFIDTNDYKKIRQDFLQKNRKKLQAKREYNLIFIDRHGEKKNVLIDVSHVPDSSRSVISFKDYTILKKTKEAFRESEEKYKKIITNASDIIMSVNNKGFIVFANKAFRKISRYSKEEVSKLHFSKLIHPDDYDRVVERFMKRMNGKRVSFLIEFKALIKGGVVKIMNMTSSPIVEGGKIIGSQAILRDVTENRKLLKQIEGSKKHYEQVIDTIKDAICVIDEDFNILSTNRVFAQKVNLNIKKIKYTNCKDVLLRFDNNLFVGDCDQKNCKSFCRIMKVFKTKRVDTFVKKSISNNNKIFYHRINLFHNKKTDSDKNEVVMVVRDITKRTIAENSILELNELNKSIMDNIPVSIITLNKKGEIISENKYISKISKKDSFVGRNIFESTFYKRNNLINFYKELLVKGKSFSKSNCKTTNKNNEVVYINIIAVAIRDKNNKISGAVSMAWDNTEATISKEEIETLNERLEKKVVQRTWQLGRANKELANVLELKSKFISDASHELRTPLTIMQGNIDLAIHGAKIEGKNISEEYHTIYKEVQRMSGILSDLTILTNADADKESLEYEPVFPGMIIRNTIDALQVLARQKNIKLKIKNKSFPKNVHIKGDEAKLEKLLLNIVRNSIKYTEPNGWIKLGLKKGKTGIMIGVEDNGIGIPKQDIPYIFERFYRVDKARSRQEGGTGLGLSICKWIVEAHCGTIKVESEEETGTNFSILLPYDFKKGGITDDSF